MALAALIAALTACEKKITDATLPNQPPETYLFLRPDTGLGVTTSRQILHWWGDDPDGRVTGFVYTFDPTAPEITTWTVNGSDPNWTFTTAYTDTFALRFTGKDSVFVFRIKAVDDQGATDPSSASQKFPVKNSPPVVNFVPGTEIPDTTFTVAGFSWTGTDLDGDDTIARYEYQLDDTAGVWRPLSSTNNFLLLRESDGLAPGHHILYLRAVDIAGVASATVRMPATGSGWTVKAPVGRYLVIDDYSPVDDAASFYRAVLDTVVGVHSVLDIKSKLLPPSQLMFQETLLLFERVIWYADDMPHLTEASIALPVFQNRGGKVIFSTLFKEFFSQQGDPLDFSPVDSLGQNLGRLFNNTAVNATAVRPSLPGLRVRSSSGIIPFVKEVVPKPTSSIIYVLPASASWQGTPAIAVEDVTHAFVFFGVPIHQLNGAQTAGTMIQRILVDIFGGV